MSGPHNVKKPTALEECRDEALATGGKRQELAGRPNVLRAMFEDKIRRCMKMEESVKETHRALFNSRLSRMEDFNDAFFWWVENQQRIRESVEYLIMLSRGQNLVDILRPHGVTSEELSRTESNRDAITAFSARLSDARTAWSALASLSHHIMPTGSDIIPAGLQERNVELLRVMGYKAFTNCEISVQEVIDMVVCMEGTPSEQERDIATFLGTFERHRQKLVDIIEEASRIREKGFEGAVAVYDAARRDQERKGAG